MKKVTIRYQEIKDAKRFFEILNNPNFIYFYLKIKSVADEREYLKQEKLKRKNNLEWNYTILYGDEIIGGIGFKINQFRKYVGELGYFIDEKYWGKGIVTAAVKLAEKEGFKKLGLTRIEIIMRPENIGSEKVAIKNGYKKEGLLKKYLFNEKDGKKKDGCLYVKTL